MSENTTATNNDNLANVPNPAGATSVAEWDNPADPTTRRYFTGTMRVIDRTDDGHNGDIDIEVEVWGTQTQEGEVYRHVDVAEGGYERLTFSSSAHVRQFGEALIAAADEVEQMNGYDRIELALSRYSVRELVDELVRRLGVDEVCRQLEVASVDELNRFAAVADGDEVDQTASRDVGIA